jgi:transaldolase
MFLDQASNVIESFATSLSFYVLIFAKRVADSQIDPLPIITEIMSLIESQPFVLIHMGKPKELLDIFQVVDIGCHVITLTNDTFKKLH